MTPPLPPRLAATLARVRALLAARDRSPACVPVPAPQRPRRASRRATAADARAALARLLAGRQGAGP